MLRPSASKLFLIDMQSTNGTRCNSVLVNGARALSHNDTISLGNLTFEIKIIDSR
jgi:pSer/pThr/pTyr-binding forkhead associated (FHA) protein